MKIPPEKNKLMFSLLVEGRVEDYNAERAKGFMPDFENMNLRGLDLKNANLNGVSLKGSIIGYSDLRGLDLRACDMEGASIKMAKISGVYFPENLAPDEILMSIQHGTRLRTIKKN